MKLRTLFRVMLGFILFSTLQASKPFEIGTPGKGGTVYLPMLSHYVPPKAFPGAIGYGTDTPGGRGGRVIYVTSLNDSGSGSLREALESKGARVVLFRVSGTINLSSDLVVKNPYLTVAGQTAPGEGVQIRGAQIKIVTHDVVLRYLKVRSGDALDESIPADRDAMTLNSDTNLFNVVVDHCTLIWGPDIGGLTFLNGARDSTVSDSIIGEGLYLSSHPEGSEIEGGHSTSMNITELSPDSHPSRISVHHNLITTSSDRNPRIIGGENIDVVNNVIYNWLDSPSQGNPRSLNLIKNFYIKGPMNTRANALVAWLPRAEAGDSLRQGSVYEEGNLSEGFSTLRGNPQSVYVTTRFQPYSMPSEDSPREVYGQVVAQAGASCQVRDSHGNLGPVRDSVDQRIIDNLVNRTGAFLNGIGYDGRAGFQAISWPSLAAGPVATDQDLDGMPDDWERAHFGTTERGDPFNSSSDYDHDGYTDLEEYLNQSNPAGA